MAAETRAVPQPVSGAGPGERSEAAERERRGPSQTGPCVSALRGGATGPVTVMGNGWPKSAELPIFQTKKSGFLSKISGFLCIFFLKK